MEVIRRLARMIARRVIPFLTPCGTVTARAGLFSGSFLGYEEVDDIQHGIEIPDILVACDPVLAIDHHAWCAGDAEKLHITLAFAQLAIRCE